MAKGQKRSNREKKKPKASKKNAAPTASPFASTTPGSPPKATFQREPREWRIERGVWRLTAKAAFRSEDRCVGATSSRPSRENSRHENLTVVGFATASLLFRG